MRTITNANTLTRAFNLMSAGRTSTAYNPRLQERILVIRHQCRDLIRWVDSAKMEAEENWRGDQELSELNKGGRYTKTKWTPR